MAATADTAAGFRIAGPAGAVKKDRKEIFSAQIDPFNRSQAEQSEDGSNPARRALRMPSISPLGPSATCSTSAGTGSEAKTISFCAPSQDGSNLMVGAEACSR